MSDYDDMDDPVSRIVKVPADVPLIRLVDITDSMRLVVKAETASLQKDMDRSKCVFLTIGLILMIQMTFILVRINAYVYCTI